MKQIFLAYGLHKETAAAIVMLYKNTKVKVQSPDEDAHFFDIVTGVLPKPRTLNVDRFNERKWLYTGKGKKQTIPRTNDYGRRLRLWHSSSGKYTPQAHILLHSLEKAADAKGLHVKVGKT